MNTGDEPHPIPIDGVLDLHTFRPEEIGELIPDYLEACRDAGIMEVRVIHGRGIGNLQRGVHALLVRLPIVERFALATPMHGGIGATMVHLRKREK
jgi:DNA-nicking Smr family endonuclease